MSEFFDRWKVRNGAYDGTEMLADMTGLPLAEVRWTAARIKELIVVEKRTKEEAVATIKIERANKPWLNKTGS